MCGRCRHEVGLAFARSPCAISNRTALRGLRRGMTRSSPRRSAAPMRPALGLTDPFRGSYVHAVTAQMGNTATIRKRRTIPL